MGGGRAWPESHRRAWQHTARHASLVWRAPEGPGGLAAVPVGGGRAWPESHRRAWQHTARHASLVWMAPEGPGGLAAVPVGGGGAWPGFETTRRAEGSQRGRLAGGRARRRPEHQRCHKQQRAAPKARSADGSRAGRRPRRSPALACGNPAPQMRDGVSPTQSGGRV